MGFLSRQLRARDYLLGRDNCQKFLMDEFNLDQDNPLFRGLASRCPGVAEEYRPRNKSTRLTVIPVVPPLRVAQPVPEWPVNAVHPETLRSAIATRSGLVLQGLLENNGIDIPFERFLIDTLLDGKIADAVERQVGKAITKEGLA
jgi:hypothetical protein